MICNDNFNLNKSNSVLKLTFFHVTSLTLIHSVHARKRLLEWKKRIGAIKAQRLPAEQARFIARDEPFVDYKIISSLRV